MTNDYIIFCHKRSGSHAITNWIKKSVDYRLCLQNNSSKSHYFEVLSKRDTDPEFKETNFLFTFETAILPTAFTTGNDPIILLRNPIEAFASWLMMEQKTHTVKHDEVEKYAIHWISLATAAMFCPTIFYDEWKSDITAREAYIILFDGYDSNEAAANEIPLIGDSSWFGFQYQGKGLSTPAYDRWQGIRDNPLFNHFIHFPLLLQTAKDIQTNFNPTNFLPADF